MAGSRLIYLLRHGRIQNSGEQRRYIGQLDVPLDPEGIRQAERLRERLAPVEFQKIFCSDLERSRETARILAGANAGEVVVCPELREIHLGEWEGMSFAEVVRRFPEKFEARGRDIAYYRIRGGESFADCSQRVLPAYQKIVAETDGPVAIVGHAGVNRLILCHLLGMPIANLFRISQDFSCVNLIHYNGINPQLRLINAVAL
jgi:probable phosphoglycerate mutase